MPAQNTYGIKQALPYSWYRQHFIPTQNLDDAGNASQPLSEAQWNAMDPNQQYSAVSIGSYGVDPNDPVLQGINSRYAAAGNQGQGVMANEVNRFNDPSRVLTDPTTGIRMTSQDNIYKSPDRLTPAVGIGAVLGAGFLNNFLTQGGLLGGGAPTGAANPNYWSMTADAGNIASDASPLGAYSASPYAGVDLSGLPTAGSTVGHSIGGGLASGMSPGLFSMLGSGDFSGAASHVGDWAMSNPLQAAGVLQTLGGISGHNLLGGGGPSGGGNYTPTSSYNSGSKGGGGQYTPNPYTARQLQQYQRGMGL